MPTIPTMPPHDRFFARLERFQCACPSCGRLLTSTQDQGYLARHFKVEHYAPEPGSKAHKYRRRMRTVKSVQYLTWNPFTQRLTCPWCNNAFVAGLVLYPVKRGGARPTEAPQDAVANRRERLELRRLAGGFHVEGEHEAGAPVNLAVEGGCRCPERGWAASCPVHGHPQGGEETVPDSRRGGKE